MVSTGSTVYSSTVVEVSVVEVIVTVVVDNYQQCNNNSSSTTHTIGLPCAFHSICHAVKTFMPFNCPGSNAVVVTNKKQ